MDVNDQPREVGIRYDGDAAKWPLKQSAGAMVGVIDRSRVSVEEMRELPAGIGQLDET